MQRQWLNVKCQIIDMEPTPAPAPPKRQRAVSRRVDAVLVVVCIICIAAEFAAGVVSIGQYGVLSGLPFHAVTVVTVVMAALTWGAFKPEAYRS